MLETLENRQLLSVGSVNLNSVVAQPSLAANPTPLISSLYPSGLSPSEVRQAYGVNQVTFQNGTVAGYGAGQTIAIVEAYNDPNISSDLKQFDRAYDLPAPPSFTKYLETGATQTNPGWSLETALDVEWAHAMAPEASIVLVEAKSATISQLFSAVSFARSLNGVVAVSMSWGTSEFAGETAYDSLFTTPAGHIGGDGLPGGVTFVAATGDSGAWYGESYPAASPNVLSVGATTLYLGANSTYGGEFGWTDSTGGFSVLEAAPAYQVSTQTASGLSYGLRTLPDVAAVGNPATGLSVYDSVRYQGQSGWFSVGGTSAAAPQWAGLIAVADQGLALAGVGSLANAQSALYALPSSSFHPVTSGFNGYSAGSGYNLVTGLGTPIANRVVAGLLAAHGVSQFTGFNSPYVPGALSALTALPTLETTSSSSTTILPAPGTAAATAFPAPYPSIVVVVFPLGPTHVVVFIPPPPTHSLFASNNHFVQPETPSLLGLSTSTPSTLNSFGQIATMDTLLWRGRFGSEPEIAALIDVVQPFEVPAPGAAPNKAAIPFRTGTTAMFAPWNLPSLLRHDAGQEDDENPDAGLSGVAPAAGVFGATASEDESQSTGTAPRLTFAAAMAAAGYWIALRDGKGRKPGWSVSRADLALQPRVRRISFPAR